MKNFRFATVTQMKLKLKIICDSWVVVMFTFILDLAAVNARAILKYNKANHGDTRRIFSQNLAISLMILYLK